MSSLRDGLLQIKASEPVTSGLAVSVELEDALVIGEVTQSAPKPDAWLIEIRVEQILNGLMNLMALQTKLLGESVKPPLAVPQPISRPHS